MRKIIISITSSLIILGCGSEKKEVVLTEKKEINIVNNNENTEISNQTIYKVTKDSLSNLKWTGSALGKEHYGTVDFEGSLGIVKGKIISGLLIFDLRTINTQDLEGDSKFKLDNHLKNKDFFSIEKFPSAQLEIKSYDGTNLKGALTIKDITKEITFPASVKIDKIGVIGKAEFTIDRTEYGIVYGSGNFFDLAADKAISDEIRFNVSIRAIQ
jgi:hypothetical protein